MTDLEKETLDACEKLIEQLRRMKNSGIDNGKRIISYQLLSKVTDYKDRLNNWEAIKGEEREHEHTANGMERRSSQDL